MFFIRIILTSFLSLFVLFILAKIMGNKQLSQLNTFDYITGITIGSIAAELATTDFTDVLKPLIAMIIYGLVTICISFLSMTNMTLRRFFTGKNTTLYKNGKLYRSNFKTAKLDISEFMSELRVMGYFSLKEVEEAYLEGNGKISVLPKSDKKYLTPFDMGMKPKKAVAEYTFIMDGSVLYDNLKEAGKDEAWLKNKLSENNINQEDVFYAQSDGENDISIYAKINDKKKNDIFQ
ncbi:MAG: DUF421 domain-containing protein [Acutalibacteraceae bacterium]